MSMMLVVWSLLVALAAFGVFRGISAVRTRGMTVVTRANRVTVVFAAIVIIIAWGLFAATQLGFIPNHAP
jgi:hypothetical protein